jgi:ATP phosphoribosyltransferase regulatory subunit
MEDDLFDALQRQSRPDVAEILSDLPDQRSAFLTLLEIRGGDRVIENARRVYAEVSEAGRALSNLAELVGRLAQTLPGVQITVDLSDLRGYRYHTGTVFNAYTPGFGRALAQGGRYDEIGRAYGRARSATGFSSDLRQLLRYDTTCRERTGILAPPGSDAELDLAVKRLRTDGERVIRLLPGEMEEHLARQCDRRLVKSSSGWRVESIDGQR